jgi:16S rRNA (adenine1518-N6/adenine1519-N6)-dimethyltransferase
MKPKKSLGQNFLRDKIVLDKIISTANLSADDFIVEIGPGNGILTEELIKRAGKVLAIEIDKNLADKLDSRFRGNDKIKIINDDILKINFPEIISGQLATKPSPVAKTRHPLPQAGEEDNVGYKLVANIPYYITSPIIQLFLETEFPPTEMILMVQKEVAERIVSKPGKMSILAVSVQYYAKAELLFYVDKKSFWPMPEVDSAVIRVTHNLERISLEERKKFFRVVKAGFSSKRKTLLNNLSSSFHLEKNEAEEKIKKAGIDPGCRAQELSVEDWKKLSQEFI